MNGSSSIEKLRWVLEHPSRFCRYLLGFTPTDYQEKLIDGFLKNDFVALRWSRQTGKSHTVSALLLWYALTHPGSYIAVFGPSWRQTKLIIHRINGFLQKLPNVWYGKPRRISVELTNNSRIEAFPNNPETVRGPTFDIIYCDEISFIPNDEDLFDAILWTIVTKKRGKFVCSSTPWNQDSVFWRIWNEPAFADYYKSHITWRDAVEPNGPLSMSKLEELKKQYEGDEWRWTREMEAEWSEDEDHWLPQAAITSCIDGNLRLRTLDNVMRGAFFLGLDLGKVNDFSVVSALGRADEELHLHLCHQFPSGTPYASVIGYVKALQDRWPSVRAVWVDQTGVGESIVEEMVRGGIGGVVGVKFTDQRKEEMASALKRVFTEQVIRIPYDRDIIAELNLERFKLTKAGGISFYHPKGTHDDRFWSIALAVSAAKSMPKTEPQVGFGRVREK